MITAQYINIQYTQYSKLKLRNSDISDHSILYCMFHEVLYCTVPPTVHILTF